MNHKIVNPSYYLLTQGPNDLLILGIKGQKYCLRRTAAEILAEPRIMAGLSAEDADLVKTIARMGVSHNADRKKQPRKKVRDCISSNT